MTQPQQIPTPTNMLVMWGIPNQSCCHGDVMVTQTDFEFSSLYALGCNLISAVLVCEVGGSVRLDPRILSEFQPPVLLEKAKTGLQALPELRLPADITAEAIRKQADLMKDLQAGRRPDVGEQITRATFTICQEAGQHLRRAFDAAADEAPSKVDEVVDDLVKAIDQMAACDPGDAQAVGRFIQRAEQITGLTRWRQELPESTFKSLERQLLQAVQTEHNLALDWLVADRFRYAWQDARNAFKARLDQFRENSQAFRTKVRRCIEELDRFYQRAKQRTAALRSGNRVLLGGPRDEELRSALMENRKAGSQVELFEGLRHDFEIGLRERALRRGLGTEIQQAPFRRLVLALPADDIVEVFLDLLIAGVSKTYSLYEACQAYGLRRLVSELILRSRTTSWFEGRDDPRFGIIRCNFEMVRLPAAANPKDAEIKAIIETYFREAGFHEIKTSGYARSISVLRINAGWPLGIEGGNVALLQAYGRSVLTGHLPHLIGILPDSQAGRHAPGLLRLLGMLEENHK